MAHPPEHPDDIMSGRAIIIDAVGRYLLGLRPMTADYNPGCWELFGGKYSAEKLDRRSQDTALREGGEETRLTLELDTLFPDEIELENRPQWPGKDGRPAVGRYRSIGHHVRIVGSERALTLSEHVAFGRFLPDVALALPDLTRASRVGIWQSQLAHQMLVHTTELVNV